MMRSRFFHPLITIFCVLLLLFGVGHGLLRHLSRSTSFNIETVYLYIEPGKSVRSIAQSAADLGLVREPWHFKLVARWRGLDRRLNAGEYALAPRTSLYDTLSKIEYRAVHQRRLVVPEGASVADIEILLAQSFGLDMATYQKPPEGSLMPETYFYERGDAAVVLLTRMQNAMAIALDDLWSARAPDLPVSTKEEALILASIVEKETAVATERPLVAAVFSNRLKKGMRLQSDPTVIYGITGGSALNRALTATDLRQDTPYNSYRRGGLPPTPIANPGRASLAAVMNPAVVPYLYFVADGTGGHAFATTLTDHNRNVARWRQIEKNNP